MVKGHDSSINFSVTYLIRILLGLLIVGMGVSASLVPELIGSEKGNWLLLAILLAGSIGMVPIIYAFVARSDEFHKAIHFQASAMALPVLFSIFAFSGVLQANGLLPDVNAFWGMSMIGLVWGICLMLSDRRYHA